MTAIQGLVEDDHKRVAGISIYNFPCGKKKYNQIFHKDLVIFVKEPYFKSSAGGFLNIRIDDPEDIEFAGDAYILPENTNF